MKKIIISAILPLCAMSAMGWSQKGHDTTVAIAERHLTPTTKHAVDSIFEGRSLVYYANWLDNASHTPEYNYSQTWHYKNIDAGETFDSAPRIPEGDIVRALTNQAWVLKSVEKTPEEKALALKMVIHFLGDIHQPMHLGHASDRGGNGWKVKVFYRDTNLHSAWDNSLPNSGHSWSFTEWADQIDRVSDATVAEICKGNATDWARETYDICTEVYDTTPQGTNISYDYIAKWTPVVEEQFLKGGLRLADLLNSIFDPEYTGYNTVCEE